MDKLKENRALNEQEIKEGKTILRSMPAKLIVTLSSKCNVRCIMCEVRHTSWNIPGKTVAEITSLFPYLESISWQGGEVFFLDSFEPVFDEAKKHKHMKQTIVSNGLLLNDKWIEKITGTNMELALSIDGTRKEVYEKIRQGSRFDVLMRNIGALNEARKKSNSSLLLRMHTVVMRSNYKQMSEFVDLAKKCGFDALHLMPLWGKSNDSENIFLSPDKAMTAELSSLLEKTEEKARGCGMELLNSLPITRTAVDTADTGCKKEEYKGLRCYLPWKQMNIDPGGGLRPGCSCKTSAGQVQENSVLELWNGPIMQEYRKTLLNSTGSLCARNCFEAGVDIPSKK